MPKIFRGIMPPPQPPASRQPPEGGAGLAAPTQPAQPGQGLEPERRKYSRETPYRRYQARQDPVSGASNKVLNRLGAFKEQLRRRRGEKSSAGDVFGSKLHLRLDILRERASGASSVIMAGRHRLEQAQAREEMIERHFGSGKGRWVSRGEYEQKIRQLKKDIPWMKSYPAKEQAKADLKALQQLRGGK